MFDLKVEKSAPNEGLRNSLVLVIFHQAPSPFLFFAVTYQYAALVFIEGARELIGLHGLIDMAN